MYYSSPLHKGTLINYEDMRILKYRGETKYGSFVLICGRNPVPRPRPLSLHTHTLGTQINILQINLEQLWRDGRMEGSRGVGMEEGRVSEV